MGSCFSRRNPTFPVRVVRRDAVSISPVYDPDTGSYLGYLSKTTTASGSIQERFEPELQASPAPSPWSESSSGYLEPLEFQELRADLEDELSTRF